MNACPKSNTEEIHNINDIKELEKEEANHQIGLTKRHNSGGTVIKLAILLSILLSSFTTVYIYTLDIVSLVEKIDRSSSFSVFLDNSASSQNPSTSTPPD